MRDDWESEAFTVMHQESQKVKDLVNQMNMEFQSVLRETLPMGNRWDLGEVLCSENSPLTQQVLNAKGHAFRFGLSQGDVSTIDGNFDGGR